MIWALEDRVVWGGADVLRGALDAVRWPFERAAWTIERHLIWPLEERASELSRPLRLAGTAAVAAVAIGAVALGVVWANGGTAETKTAPAAAAISAPPQREAVTAAAPVLRGAAPDFTPEADGGAGQVGGAEALPDATATTGSGAASASSSAAASGAPAGPAALEVARSFAAAFVLYETGEDGGEVRSAFHQAATPQLARSLLRRPPRLPAAAKVPKAKVLNVVPGPSHDGVYTISVSLLRVGLTSELRLDMEHDRKTGKWQVTDVLG